ncbi:NUDIX domain-containing protein [Desulforamulus aquiferis]|uniref:NUDIX domain-containing protein n=1 Tax=Desulforamulus aquiferis TaxID=1397668 RepID=A0AAW7ZEH6_9FIRM|nr:NUDIX domain-containing protein [Desulforamulus aquiferis]MDO7787786.1 NUDIX domain-containing protein [Desulforamulus aquiferis]RYD05072.1 hypothetical protein N752_10900 [Desulforamulus aquiferis]
MVLAGPKTKYSIRVMIINPEGEVLLGLKNRGFHSNNWIFPGGQIEFGETIAQCAAREVLEECNMEVTVQGLIDVVSESCSEKHVVFINLVAYGQGKAEVTEPQEVKEWRWYPAELLPENTTISAKNAVRKFSGGQMIPL